MERREKGRKRRRGGGEYLNSIALTHDVVYGHWGHTEQVEETIAFIIVASGKGKRTGGEAEGDQA